MYARSTADRTVRRVPPFAMSWTRIIGASQSTRAPVRRSRQQRCLMHMCMCWLACGASAEDIRTLYNFLIFALSTLIGCTHHRNLRIAGETYCKERTKSSDALTCMGRWLRCTRSSRSDNTGGAKRRGAVDKGRGTHTFETWTRMRPLERLSR
jgi:hypothetical protein